MPLNKTRRELPWLYYPESDRVIINAHNFTPIWTPSVNGKNPIHAWVPSRDNVGNGTTTLTDLVGSNNGTLTLMDAATDWVSDTGAGGVRALDFDGTNDSVIATVPTITTQMSQSYWFKRSVTSVRASLVGFGVSGTVNNRFVIQPWNDAKIYVSINGANYCYFTSNDTTWHHVVAVFDGAQTGNSNRIKVYFDGSPVTLTFVGTIPSSIGSPNILWIGKTFVAVPVYGSGRVDDYRIFDVALDGTDAADLYASGSGRGVQA